MHTTPMRTDLDIDLMRRLLSYDPDTGHFTWLVSRKGRGRVGRIAGRLNTRGYITIGLNWQRWLAHRLAWAYVHGELPAGILDHINRVRTDNRIANLRIVTRRENMMNSDRMDARAIGAAGATLTKRGRWQAQITINGEQKYLGLYDTAAEANAAYEATLSRISEAMRN